MIDEKLLIDELKLRVRTARSTMEILRDIVPLVEMQPKIDNRQIRSKVIEEFLREASKDIYDYEQKYDFCTGANVILENVAERMLGQDKMSEEAKNMHIKPEMIGDIYRYFNGGVYVVTDLAVHTETKEITVICKNINDPIVSWCIPLDTFRSPVDKKKYPNVKQKMKFERIEVV